MSWPIEKPRHGFVLGKFMPPHAGHVFLCDFARAYCQTLTILVCSLEREPIPGELRHRWMSELFADCRVIHWTEDLPQEPHEHPDFWNIWREQVRAAHPEPIDVVFASEPYGARLAEELGAAFVPVDPGRTVMPVSGTEVRRDPFAAWRYIPAPVRPYFVRRVCLFGPESTGKTTLANALAQRFDTACATEYGRTYTDTFGTACNADDLRRIAAGHLAGVEAAARAANRILVCDTDPVLTGVWSQMLMGVRDPWFDDFADLCDLYLLTDVEMPWADDGTRYFPGDDDRRRFFDLCEAELVRRAARFVRLSGPAPARLDQAVAAVEVAFPGVRG